MKQQVDSSLLWSSVALKMNRLYTKYQVFFQDLIVVYRMGWVEEGYLWDCRGRIFPSGGTEAGMQFGFQDAFWQAEMLEKSL